MKLSNRDLKKLSPPLAIMMLLCGIAGTLAWVTEREVQQARVERNQAAEAKTRIEMRLRQFHSDELEIKDRGQLLQRLQARGIIGEEKRLDWTEQLRDTQRELHLPGMKYEFAPQTGLQNGNTPGYGWFNSPMRLQLRLLHEGDLLNFLDRIQREAKALVVVRACKLAAPPTSTGNRETLAALDADCELDWLSAHRPAGKG